MSSTSIYELSRRSSSRDSRRMIAQGQELRLFSEKWCATTWTILSHYSLIRKYFGEELQKNCCGSSKDRPMQMSSRKKTLRYGQETALKSIWIALESIEKLEILDQYMDFSGGIGMHHTSTGTQSTLEKGLISCNGWSTKSKETPQAGDWLSPLGTLLNFQKWHFLQ